MNKERGMPSYRKRDLRAWSANIVGTVLALYVANPGWIPAFHMPPPHP